jgi:hypothetical protein
MIVSKSLLPFVTGPVDRTFLLLDENLVQPRALLLSITLDLDWLRPLNIFQDGSGGLGSRRLLRGVTN